MFPLRMCDIKKYVMQVALAAAICLGMMPVDASAQPDLRFDRVGADEIGYTVKDILTDRFGMLWLATHEGLLRYDGYHFRSYRRDPGDPNSLAHNDVNVLAEGPDGHIWVGTDGGGLDRLDPETGTFTHFMPSSIQTDGPRQFITALQVHTDGKAWVSSISGGLYRFDPETEAFLTLSQAGETPGMVYTFHQDRQGRLWLGAADGMVYQADPETGNLTPYRVGTATAVVRALASDGQRLWVGMVDSEGGGALCTLNPNDGQVEAVPLGLMGRRSAVWALAFDAQGTLWIGTMREGLYQMDRAAGILRQHVFDATNLSSLGNNHVRVLHSDARGMLWIGTDLGGLNKLNLRQGFFGRYRLDAATLGLREEDVGVYAVHATADGTRWLGTLSGLIRVDGPDAAPVRYVLHPDPDRRVNVYAIAEEASGVLWLGTGIGLIRFIPASGRATPFVLPPVPNHRSTYDTIYDVHIDPEGHLWLATNGAGLVRFTPSTETFTRFWAEPRTEGKRNYLLNIVPHTDGTFWIGSTGGLNTFDPRTGRHTAYRSEQPLLREFIMTQTLDAEGQLWLGTFDGGLVRLDPQTGETLRYTQADGLPSNAVSALHRDAEGRLWMTFFESGLAVFDPATEAVITYNRFSGALPYYNQNAQFSLADGSLLLGGVGGLNEINPTDFNAPLAPTLLIETNNGWLYQGSARIESATLQGLLPMEIKVMDYVHPEKNRCFYRVGDRDTGWIACQRGNETFGSLGRFVGEQVMHIRGINSNGISTEATLTLSIPIPWWQRVYVRLALVLGVLGLGWSVLYLWERRKRRVQQQQQEALEEARQKEREELASWVHDGPLADLVGLRFVLEELYDYALPDQATERVDDVRDTLLAVRKSLRNVCGTLQMPNFGYGLAFAVRSHASMFQSANPTLKIHLDLEVEEDELPSHARRYLFLIYLTAMNNVVKHAEANQVWVRLKRAGRRMVLEVEDDGRGFSPPKRLIALGGKQNYGLLLAETHARNIGGELKVRSAPGDGTKLTVETGPLST